MNSLHKAIKHCLGGKTGQALIEYVVILAVFSLVVLAVIPSFRDSVGNAYIRSESKVTEGGDDPIPVPPTPTSGSSGIEYRIIYDANGGMNAPVMQTKQHGVDLPLALSIPTKSNHTFVGWSTSLERANSHSVDYNPGDLYTVNHDLLLFASWTEEDISYTLRYFVNSPAGATASFPGSESPIIRTKHSNVAAVIISEAPVCEAYTFMGWNESSTASTATYHAGDSFVDNRDADFYAIWTPVSYTVRYDANGGTGTVPNEAEYYAGSSVTVQGAQLSKPNRQFVGWSTTNTDTTVEYPVGTTLTMPSHNVVFYAVYMKTEYPYNGENGSDGSIQSFTAPVTGQYKIQLWGAKGGKSNKNGTINTSGAGGYTTLTVNLTKGQTIYFAVGGHGADNDFSRSTSAAAANPGGWNGGGNGYTDAAVDEGGNFNSSVREGSGGGGGATSAYTAQRGDGQLSNYSSRKSEILGVAGGASGANYSGKDGYGGGTSGGNSPYGGTQSSGYAFGRGESATGPRRVY